MVKNTRLVGILTLKGYMNKKTAFLTFKDPEALEFALLLSAVLRDLYAYFADRPMKEIPHIEVLLFFFGY
ncbi:putative 6-phosphofructo-2-kinase, Fructose-2,6-bisphosphate 2-phosphatase [Helianthus annuus]|nr:putative 6-phosphofructo-2-kinase, Fructose-2,6-bisphosphate 2-phosphatase [Helianthus annuus]